MSRLSILVTAMVLSVTVASANQMAFAKENHQLRQPQFASEHFAGPMLPSLLSLTCHQPCTPADDRPPLVVDRMRASPRVERRDEPHAPCRTAVRTVSRWT
jgi:hypothetical protein